MILLLVHVAATLYMTGLIWFVQLVHYPLMASVGADGYREYQRIHEKRTTLAVAPAMFIELGTAIWLVIETPAGVTPWLVWIGFVLVVLLWLSTVLLQVPWHKKLENGIANIDLSHSNNHLQTVTSSLTGESQIELANRCTSRTP